MRVLIDASYARRSPHSGTAVYLQQLLDALRALPDVEPIEVANPRRRPAAGGGIGSVRNLLADAHWTAVELPRLARRHRADVIHHPLPARAVARGVAQVITVHDLAFVLFPDMFTRAFRTYARAAHRIAARRAGAVICVSETTASDVRRLWAVPDERIVVAPHGPGQPLAALPRADPPAHFLYVGDDEPRKDLGTLIAAYDRYRERAERPLELVLAGAGRGGGPGVRSEPAVGAARLASLHAGAAALVHPALYEGFGLTLLEAMTAGTPVVAADVPAAREVCGDAARYAPPRDVEGFAAVLGELALDAPLRDSLSAGGRERAARFSWSESARAHVRAYSLARTS